MNARRLVCVLVSTLLLVGPAACSLPRHTGIILLGGTGDLARKYLWQAVFDAYVRRQAGGNQAAEGSDGLPSDGLLSWKLTVLTGSSSHASIAANRLKDIFDNNVKCAPRHGSLSACSAHKGELFEQINYFQLHLPEDYRAMCSSLEAAFVADQSGASREVLLYLSVPPSVYLQALRSFKAQCLFSGHDVALKVVLEKPQGRDFQSAEKLSRELLTMFTEEQLYRTDHYLAKSVVTNILPFRAANPQLEKLLNKDYVERVEIFLTETIGVEDRYSFYNDMGVIRDVFQNHLTQLLTLMALELPGNMSATSTHLEQAKVQILKQLTRVSPSSVLLGQYASYMFDAAQEIPDSNITSLVPTFAAALLKIRSPRWLDTPFILVSGKKLEQRSSHVRVVFKDTDVCVSNCQQPAPPSSHPPDPHPHHPHHLYQLPPTTKKQLVFQIGHGSASLPLISVSKSLGEPVFPASLTEVYDPAAFSQERSYHGDHSEEFFHATPVDGSDAYSCLVEEVLAGDRASFVSTAQLLQAWQVWDSVLPLRRSSPPRIYDAGDPAGVLNFAVRGEELRYSAEDSGQGEGAAETAAPVLHTLHQAQTPSTFLGRRMVSGTREGLAVQLAREIEQAAEADIASKGVFHLAFSGGSTPLLLWQTLAQSFASQYWAHVHVWQVDERCVRAAADTHSTLFQLDRQLLRFVAVPWAHVHAMPVDVAGRLCDPELQGDRQYADSLRHTVANLQLDFVVLGVGSDGHTASLFPHSPALSADWDTLVTLTDQGPPDTPLRMTITLPLINRARRVAVMVTGEEKQGVLDRLEGSQGGAAGVDALPILGVNPANGTLSWFIDYHAYFGPHLPATPRV